MRIPLSLALLLLALPARADRITLANGNVVEGKAEAQGDTVRVALRRGWVELPKAAVARIEAAETPWEEYERRAQALKEGDAGGHAALAAWCRTRGLPDEARAQSRMAGKEDPGQAEAEALEQASREALAARQARVRPPPLPPPEERPVEPWPRTAYRPFRGGRGHAPLWAAPVLPWAWAPACPPRPPACGLGLSASFAGGRGRLRIRIGE